MHTGKIYEGEIKSFDPITGVPERGEKISDEIVGYVAYMKLVNGFEKTIFMTIAELEEHAEKFSQGYRNDLKFNKQSSPWTTNFDAMACKTILKKLLNTWGILSADMVSAIQGDQSVADKSTFTYVDNGESVQNRNEIYVAEDENVDQETGEVVSESSTEEE